MTFHKHIPTVQYFCNDLTTENARIAESLQKISRACNSGDIRAIFRELQYLNVLSEQFNNQLKLYSQICYQQLQTEGQEITERNYAIASKELDKARKNLRRYH